MCLTLPFFLYLSCVSKLEVCVCACLFVPVNRRLPLSETVNRFLSLVVNDS